MEIPKDYIENDTRLMRLSTGNRKYTCIIFGDTQRHNKAIYKGKEGNVTHGIRNDSLCGWGRQGDGGGRRIHM